MNGKEERSEQAIDLACVCVCACVRLVQQQEIKYHGVIKTVETLSLVYKRKNDNVLYVDIVITIDIFLFRLISILQSFYCSPIRDLIIIVVSLL